VANVLVNGNPDVPHASKGRRAKQTYLGHGRRLCVCFVRGVSRGRLLYDQRSKICRLLGASNLGKSVELSIWDTDVLRQRACVCGGRLGP
jgi:hypothetical protein